MVNEIVTGPLRLLRPATRPLTIILENIPFLDKTFYGKSRQILGYVFDSYKFGTEGWKF